MSQYSYGSIIVSDDGIRKRAVPLIGKGFQIGWSDLSSWSVSQTLLPLLDSGKDEPVSNSVELTAQGGVERIDRRAAGEQLDALVAYLRLRCPEKEKRASGAGSDAV